MSARNKPELLAPAGSMESLKAAVNNGCDAVYLGGKLFSARQFAGNFSLEELEEACDYCHLRGVKVYVTINTLYKDEELKELLGFVGKLYKMGVDALIIQDSGAAKLIRENYPDLPLHASTQMTANSLEDVRYWESLGFSKIVLSRELSLEEISEITQQAEAEIETFIHGALCVCYSGQCLMSSILGGRSGNRGRCAQTCRLPYTLYKGADKLQEGYLLSPKDIQTVTILPQLIEAGIASLKIEGRMKNPEYVAGVTGIYRKYIDLYFDDPDHYQVSSEDIKALTQLFNRGGFTEGYYTSAGGKDMMSIERPKTWGLKVGIVDSYIPKHNRVTIRTREALVPGDGIEIWTAKEPHVGTNISKASKAGEVISLAIEGDIQKNDVVYRTYGKALNDALRKTWEKDSRKKSIWGLLKVKKGQPLALQLWDMSGSNIYVTGDMVESAANQPTSLEKLKQQIEKMGATSFVLEALEIDGDDDIYVSVGALNQLRRMAVEALEEAILKKSKRQEIQKGIKEEKEKSSYILQKKLHALVTEFSQLEAIVGTKGLKVIYFEASAEMERMLPQALKLCNSFDVSLYAALPKISRQWRKDIEDAMVECLKKTEIDGFLVRSAGQFGLVKDSGKKITVDYTLNVMNEEGVAFWKQQGADSVCLSVEANLKEINAMGDKDCEMVVYGYLPLMKTQQCPIGNFTGEKEGHFYCSEKNNTELYFLKDRKGLKFPLMTDCERCVCTVLNSKPLFTLKFYDEILESVTGSVRLEFTKEGIGRAARITKAYAEMTQDPNKISSETRSLLEEMREKGNTKGHFFRGVE
ncbi:MAG: U32 family peptidase [Anaerotignum propionicum]|uniref:U32 family peptidase n=1 Tax=Anaerotignum propionicum TaxID=28446 RepID=UPI002B20F95F|nr:U32 family peptidase [Anaerotignum propionicum]MEA5057178.1 U32 family peptidase [Anaerotignum propionicum]